MLMAELHIDGETVLIDDLDLPLVGGLHWHVREGHTAKTKYAWTTVEGRAVQMANFILPPKPGFTPDHKNGDGLDNRRENLRYATRAQQQRNQGSREGTSPYKGVSRCKSTGRWRADITVDWGTRNLGRYDTAEEAARAYDAAAVLLHGDFARLNFGPPPEALLALTKKYLATKRPAAKLTDEQRAQIVADPRTSEEIARAYGLSSSGYVRTLKRRARPV